MKRIAFKFYCWLMLAGLALTSPVLAAPRVAGPDLDVRSWSVDSGLPTDSVTSIQQTGEGFLWVGTEQGLARFDGWKFTSALAQGGPRVPGTGEWKVTAQCVDSSNMLWVGTERHGLFRVDPSLPQPLRALGAGLETEKINCMGSDTEGAVWIGTDTGLFQMKGGAFTQIKTSSGGPEVGVLGLQVTRSNGVWVTTRSGLQVVQNGIMQKADLKLESAEGAFRGVFEDRSGSLWGFGDTYLLNISENRRFNYFRGGGATPLQIWSICEGKPGQLWIGTSGQGLFHFGGSRFFAVNLKEARDHSDIRAVLVDKDGQIWVGTRRGLLRLRDRIVRWYGEGSGAATCLAQDSTGKVWAGFEHAGLFAGRAELMERATGILPLADRNLISSIYIRPDSSFWIGTFGNGLSRVKQGKAQHYSLPDSTVLAVCGGQGGRVWVSTADGKVHRFLEQLTGTFGAEHGLTGNPVTAMISARDGGLWLGTSQGEILRFHRDRFLRAANFRARTVWNPANKKKAGDEAVANANSAQEPHPEKAAPFAVQETCAVSALCEDDANRLWVGTEGAGLGCLIEGRWVEWTRQEGLPDNSVLGVEQSLDGHIWVATGRGVSRIPDKWIPESGETNSSASSPDVMAPSLNRIERAPIPVLVEFREGAGQFSSGGWRRSLRAREGAMWFATGAGILSFNPADLNVSPNAAKVRIEAVRANGVAVPWPDGMENRGNFELPRNLKDVQIRFTAPSLASPEKIRFRHRLEGFDADWVDSTETRIAQYGKLSSGDYRFVVQCSDRNGRWSGAQTILALSVAAPFWRMPWVLAVEAFLLAGIVAAVARTVSHRRLKRQLEQSEQKQAMERERARIAQDMHDELGAKLTKISFMSERARSELGPPAESGATNRLDSIASTSRDLLHSLDEIVWAVNPRNDSLESLTAYLGQYASEYLQNTSMEFDLRMPGPLPEVPLSAEVRHNLFLAFQEALSNALKHSGASRLHVTMSLIDGRFQVVVADNGRGLSPPEPARNGGRAARPAKRQGSGLRGMSERMDTISGFCEVKVTPGGGTTVVLSLSLHAEKHKPLRKNAS